MKIMVPDGREIMDREHHEYRSLIHSLLPRRDPFRMIQFEIPISPPGAALTTRARDIPDIEIPTRLSHKPPFTKPSIQIALVGPVRSAFACRGKAFSGSEARDRGFCTGTIQQIGP